VRHLDRSSLYSLALSNKKISPSATDALYKTYVNRSAPSIAPFALFLRTVYTRPDLADKVKLIRIRGWLSECEVATGGAWRGVYETTEEQAARKIQKATSRSHQPPRVSDTFTLFVDSAMELGLIGKRESYPVPSIKHNTMWHTTLKADRDFIWLHGHGVEDAHVVLLLALLSNLDRLEIDGLTPYPILDWSLFLSRVNTALHSLRCLVLHGSITRIGEPTVWTDLQVLNIAPALQQVDMTHQRHVSREQPCDNAFQDSKGRLSRDVHVRSQDAAEDRGRTATHYFPI